MITEQDLNEAIAECLGQRSPNANTAVKLAAFYTIRRELFGKAEELPVYSFAAAPEAKSTVIISGDSRFANAVRGKNQADIWPIIDELMQTLRLIYPRLYSATLHVIEEKKAG